jgi:hypothetical protein
MSKPTTEAVERAEQFVRSIYPLLADSIVKEVAAKVLKAMPKTIRTSSPHLP